MTDRAEAPSDVPSSQTPALSPSDLTPDPSPSIRAQLVDWLAPTPAELVGLAVLLLGSLAAGALLWFQAGQRPDELGPPSLDGDVARGAMSVPGDDVEVAGDAASADGTAYARHDADPRSDVLSGHDTPGAAASESGGDGHDGTGSDARVTVHVSGAVERPGVVELAADARVIDAIDEAGGVTSEAELARVNLARRVTDGEQIHVPASGEQMLPPATPPADDATSPVDLNVATPTELERLPGIGPAKAAAIVAHREEHGPFRVPGDLRDVPGIGEATFQGLAEQVLVR